MTKPETDKVNAVTYTKDNFLIFLDNVIHALSILAAKRDEIIKAEQAEQALPENIYKQLYKNIIASDVADEVRATHAKKFRKTIPFFKRPRIPTFNIWDCVVPDINGLIKSLHKFGYEEPTDDAIIVSILKTNLKDYTTELLMQATAQGIAHHALSYVIGHATWKIDRILHRATFHNDFSREVNEYEDRLTLMKHLHDEVMEGTEASFTIDFESFAKYNKYIKDSKGT